MDIVEVRTTPEFHALRAEWETVLAKDHAASIYLTWEWIESWWNQYRARKQLRLLKITQNGTVTGFLPLYSSLHLGTPFRRLAFIGTGASDYHDLLAAEPLTPQAHLDLLRYVAEMPEYDLADLQNLAPTSHLLSHKPALPEQRSPHQRGQRHIPMEPCPYLPLPPTYDLFLKSVGKKMRTNLGYYDRLLTRTYPDAEYGISQLDTLSADIEDTFDLHQRRWRSRNLPGVLASTHVQEFHRSVAARFHTRGWLRLHTMRAAGRCVATLYCFTYKRTCYYYLGGMDPEFSRFSVGTLLTARAIQSAIADNCTEFDFLRGAEPYKYRWDPLERINQRVVIVNEHDPRGRALAAVHQLEGTVEHHVKAWCERSGRK